MHTMMKVGIPVEKGNTAVRDGSLQRLFESLAKKIQPEAVYFTAIDGKRTALFFFEMKDASEIPGIAELAFVGVNATVEFLPVMSPAELQKGLAALTAQD